MQRGYDVLFQNRTLGATLVVAGLFAFTAFCIWGALYFKRKVAEDTASRKSNRDNSPK